MFPVRTVDKQIAELSFSSRRMKVVAAAKYSAQFSKRTFKKTGYSSFNEILLQGVETEQYNVLLLTLSFDAGNY